MLKAAKRSKLEKALRAHIKQYLLRVKKLDESGTRLMINALLTEVLGYRPIDEVKTEYMIRGSYADYVIELKGKRPFLVEAKALSLELSDKHLRQATTYGAFEGIDWALVSNGRHYQLYKIIWGKPIESRKVFSVDLADPKRFKESVEMLQYLHKDSVTSKGLDQLWKKTIALDAPSLAGLLYAPTVLNYLKRTLRTRYKHKFGDDEVVLGLDRVIADPVDLEQVNPIRVKRVSKSKRTLKRGALSSEGPVQLS